MATARRTGSENSETRSALLDATERVMVQHGYAAVSSRRIAKEAGVTPALVHYYFPTLNDLFIEVLRRRAKQNEARLERLLESPQPLQGLWRFNNEPVGVALLVEFMALANHRKPIGKEIAKHAEHFRRIQLEALSERLEEYGVDPTEVPPEAVMVMMTALSRALIQERGIGMKTGQAETLDLVERQLARLEGPPEPRSGRAAAPAKRRSGAH